MLIRTTLAVAAVAGGLCLARPAEAQSRGRTASAAQRGNFGSTASGSQRSSFQTTRDAGRNSRLSGDQTPQGGVAGQDARVGPSGTGLEAERTYQTDGFVGRDAANVAENFRNMNQQRRQGAAFDVVIESLNEMRESRRRWQAEQLEPPPVRVRLQPLFSYAPPAPAKTQAALEASFNRTWQSNTQTPTVLLNGRTATLRGTAASQRDRKLAERMASLQPGVSRVENEIAVAE